jgi:HME family heavy-metal exporter
MVPGVVDLQVEKQVLIPHSILASLLTSVTVTPVLSYYLLSGRIVEHAGDNFVARHLKRGNRGLLNWAFDHRGIVVGTAAVAVVVAAYAATLLPRWSRSMEKMKDYS